MDLSFLASPDAWLTLVTLSALEIVLGIDNLVFISIAVGRLPEAQRPLARKFGIAVACITRILLLVMLAFLARMAQDLFVLFGMGISIRDLVLILGGAFLLVMAMELMNSSMEAVIERYGAEHHELAGRAKDMGSAAVFVLMMNVILVWALILAPRYL